MNDPVIIRIRTCPEGILSVQLPLLADAVHGYSDIQDILDRLHIRVEGGYSLAGELGQEMKLYIRGEVHRFGAYSFVWGDMSGFLRKVLDSLDCIPYGATMSYGEFAALVGYRKAARAVGQALGRNPWPVLFPCHRVIGRNGELRGFSSGLSWERLLLMVEGSKKEVPG